MITVVNGENESHYQIHPYTERHEISTVSAETILPTLTRARACSHKCLGCNGNGCLFLVPLGATRIAKQ